MKSEGRAQFPIHAELTGDSYKEFISFSSIVVLHAFPDGPHDKTLSPDCQTYFQALC